MTDISSGKDARNVKKRTSSPDVNTPLKRIKTETEDESKPDKYNPYLAHWSNGNGADGDVQDEKNGFGFEDRLPKGSPLAKFQPRNTTAKQASEAEDSDNNPFTGEPHSQQYFNILKSRRNLPVHKQRLVRL